MSELIIQSAQGSPCLITLAGAYFFIQSPALPTACKSAPVGAYPNLCLFACVRWIVSVCSHIRLSVYAITCLSDCVRKVTPYPQGADDFFPLWPLVALNWPQGAVLSVVQTINNAVTLPRERSGNECQPTFSALRRLGSIICPFGQIYQQGTPRVPVGSKLYFLLHETLFAAEKGLPARGWIALRSRTIFNESICLWLIETGADGHPKQIRRISATR